VASCPCWPEQQAPPGALAPRSPMGQVKVAATEQEESAAIRLAGLARAYLHSGRSGQAQRQASGCALTQTDGHRRRPLHPSPPLNAPRPRPCLPRARQSPAARFLCNMIHLTSPPVPLSISIFRFQELGARKPASRFRLQLHSRWAESKLASQSGKQTNKHARSFLQLDTMTIKSRV